MRIVPLVLVLLFLCPGYGRGQSVDAYRGAVIQTGRILGMGGAHAAVAEGVAGVWYNPAALANRYPYSTSWWDYDLALDWFNVPGDRNADITNNCSPRLPTDGYMALVYGIGMNFGSLGLGLSGKTDQFTLAGPEGEYDFNFSNVLVGLAWALLDDQLVVGLAATNGFFAISDGAGSRDIVDVEGNGMSVGLLVRPKGRNYRFGYSFMRPVTVDLPPDGPGQVQGVKLPRSVAFPWRMRLGLSWLWSAGEDPYNMARPLRRKLRLRKGRHPFEPERRYILVAADLEVIGPAPPGSIGMESVFTGMGTISGEDPSLALHFGAETEVINNRLILRMGTYSEPARTWASSTRVHVTGGADVRLFRFLWWDWRAGFTVDKATRYLNWSLGVGFWH